MKKTFIINDREVDVQDLFIQDDAVRFTLDGKEYRFTIGHQPAGHFVLKHEGRNRAGYVGRRGAKDTQPIFLYGGVEAQITQKGLNRSRAGAGGKGSAHTAPMPGTIQQVLVKAGDVVEAGQVLVVMEAMKLQLNIDAAYAGTVEEVLCETGGLVDDGALLVKVTPPEDSTEDSTGN